MASGTILFVEDDSFGLTTCLSRLQTAGLEVGAAGDRLAATDRLPPIRPNLAVLELTVPKLRGLEVLNFIHREVNLKATADVVPSDACTEGLPRRSGRSSERDWTSLPTLDDHRRFFI